MGGEKHRTEARVGGRLPRGTPRERSYALAQMADTLHEDGYRGLRARNLKGRHVEALVRDWARRGLSDGTMKNRMAHLRWLASKIGKPNIVRANADYGIGRRSLVADGTKHRDLDEEKLALVKDAHVKMAQHLQAAFGLRQAFALDRYEDLTGWKVPAAGRTDCVTTGLKYPTYAEVIIPS